MNWQALERIAGTVCLLTLTGCALWATSKLQPILLHADGALTRLEGVESKANATLVNLDNGTKVWAASAKQQSAAVEDLATDAHGTLSQLNNLAFSLNESAVDLHENLAALHKTIDAATETTLAATVDLATLNQTILGAQPVLASGKGAVDDLRALLKDQAIHQLAGNLASATGHADAILGDGQKVADKVTADFLKPRPWYAVPTARLGQTWDIVSAVARHAP